ncbi:MAG: hypothetical protein U0169_21200 [Polyangiaceae bacterium]
MKTGRAHSMALGLVTSVAVCTFAPEVRADGEDKRAAARALAEEGIRLQQEGNCYVAIDRLERAQALFDAPTHLLHVAECQETLGRLVSASDTYKKLVASTIAPDAPPAFARARETGRDALGKLTARIPGVKIVVRPADAIGLKVTIDGHTMPLALLGQEQLFDPGNYRIEASASGFEPKAESVTLAVGEHKSLVLDLGGGSWDSEPTSKVDAGSPTGLRGRRPISNFTEFGISLGARGSGAFTGGNIGSAKGGARQAASDYFRNGGGLELDLGVRFARRFHAFAFYSGSFLAPGRGFDSKPGEAHGAKVLHDSVGLGGEVASGAIFGPSVRLRAELGIAPFYRFRIDDDVTTSTGTCSTRRDIAGFAGRAGFGADVALGADTVLTPFGLATIGSLGRAGLTSHGSACGTTTDTSGAIAERDLVWTLSVGVGISWAYPLSGR